MIEIPKQLRNELFRFIKIRNKTKTPLEQEWQLGNNYKWNEDKFQEYLKSAKSYGVVCGYGHLAVIDCDREELAREVFLKLPKTFTAETGSGRWHIYYIIPDLKEKIIVSDEKKHYGEVQFTDSQVLGIGSLHPNGNHYKTLYDKPIKTISVKELKKVITPFLKTETETNSTGLNLDIENVAKKISGLNKNHDGSLQGCHPVHGSSGGSNFRIDFDKGDGGVWHCFRCGTGGDALTLIGVLEGIIDCSECRKGLFKDNPEKFQEILKVADKYGYEIDNTKINTVETVPLFLGKRHKLNVTGVVNVIKNDIIFVTIKDSTGKKPQLYYYKDGYYHIDGWFILEKKIKEILKENWSTRNRDEIRNYILTENLVDRDKVVVNPNLINLNNGVFDVKNNKLLKHDPKYYFLYKIPWNYNPKAKCPKIEKFLSDTLDEEFVEVSKEIFGYCLYGNYFIPSIFYLYGTGGNGKSVWSTILTNLLGYKNISALEVHSIFENRFAAASLYGKLANICGEIDQKSFSKTHTIKDLTGGNYIFAELKGRDPFKFLNRAKIISSCNEMPYCSDSSEGWEQRQYVIPFLKKFRGEDNEQVNLGEILSSDTNEMEGLLKTSIEALQTIIKNKKFSYKGYREKYNEAQYGVKEFLSVFIENSNDANDYISNIEIYQKCKLYCNIHKIPTPNARTLGRELTYLGFKTDIIWIGGKTLRVKKFCKWNEQAILTLDSSYKKGKKSAKK